MLSLWSEHRSPWSQAQDLYERGRRSLLGRRERAMESAPALTVASLVAIGLIAWSCYKFGPELRRYLKIKSM